MSYHAGVGGHLAVTMGIPECGPHIKCDGCGVEKHIKGRGAGGNIAPSWLLDNKAPPGWKLVRSKVDGDAGRVDYCPKCKVGK